jgi:hypothetical protein
LEAILNYAYWQTLSLNEFDSVGHVLRAVGIQDPQCSNFLNDLRPPSRGGTAEQNQIRERCNSYLGPNQPGVTTSDPTGNGASAAGRTPAKKRGERRKAGQPEAGPVPGQTDWSKPHPGLSSSQQDLLNAIGGHAPQVPSTPGVPALPQAGAPGADASGAVSQALDYLLGP